MVSWIHPRATFPHHVPADQSGCLVLGGGRRDLESAGDIWEQRSGNRALLALARQLAGPGHGGRVTILVSNTTVSSGKVSLPLRPHLKIR